MGHPLTLLHTHTKSPTGPFDPLRESSEEAPLSTDHCHSLTGVSRSRERAINTGSKSNVSKLGTDAVRVHGNDDTSRDQLEAYLHQITSTSHPPRMIFCVPISPAQLTRSNRTCTARSNLETSSLFSFRLPSILSSSSTALSRTSP